MESHDQPNPQGTWHLKMLTHQQETIQLYFSRSHDKEKEAMEGSYHLRLEGMRHLEPWRKQRETTVLFFSRSQNS